MLITKEVEVKLNGKKIKHYDSLGYPLPKRKTKDGMRVPKNALLKVKIEDVPLGSHIDVVVKCDYCGKEYSTRYDGYLNRKKNDIPLDCCDECKSIKNKELNIIRYGVENQFQREEIKIKVMKIKSNNNGIKKSKQQIYLCNLFNGKLNYIDDLIGYYAIDIALIDKKIAIEYGGSGHDLQVKFGNLTREEFKQKEIIRYQILKRNGWKQIFINSSNDYLPSDEVLLEEFNKALEWFKSNDKGHYHYNIDIGNKINDDKYGKLRRITENNLKIVS